MAGPRRRLKVMSLTDAAATRVREIMENAEKPLLGLRVGVKNGGCAGMSYTMEMAEAAAPSDEVVEDKGVTVLVDPKAILFLSARRWISRPRNCPRVSSSIIRTRLQPVAAARALQ